MKLVEMDSSFAERKEMALDLGYTQEDIDSKGSAEMNMWLHKKKYSPNSPKTPTATSLPPDSFHRDRIKKSHLRTNGDGF